MSGTRISGHIPDIDLITYYSENQRSFMTGVSPWTKAVALVVIIVFITIVQSLTMLACLYLAILTLFWLSGLPVRTLFSWYLLPMLFVLSLVVLLMWNQPGTTLFTLTSIGIPLTLSDKGLLLVVTLTLKALISVTYSLLFLMTTKYSHFSAMIYRLFPSPVDQVFLMSYRFIFITLKTVDAMLKALRSRGSGLMSGVRRQSRMFAEVFALIFIRSFDRAERVSKAMESRGFTGKYFALSETPKMRIYDIAIIAAVIVLGTCLALLKLP